MKAFTTVREIAVPYGHPNVDTDQLIPARFLKYPRDERYPDYFFHDLRLDGDGNEKPDFILNQEPWRQAKIMVADSNFGCGSSRESAVYVLVDTGYRAVIASSFGDIFYNNAFKNGFLPVRLDQKTVEALRRELEAAPGSEIEIDLEAQTVTGPEGKAHTFEIDGFRKHCLINGLDDITFTLEQAGAIEAFEASRGREAPWLDGRLGR